MAELKIVEKPYTSEEGKTRQFKITTDSELVEIVEGFAKKFGVSMTLIAEQALIQYIYPQ